MGTGRTTNLALAALLVASIVTGFLSFGVGADWMVHPSVFHGVVALGIVLLSPWKAVVVRRGLYRPRGGRVASLIFLGIVLVALGSGLVHSAALMETIGGLTIMQVHVGSALVALALGLAHYRRHPQRMRSTDLDRRGFLRAATLGIGSAGLWLGWEGAGRGLGWAGARRRFTGSHEIGSLDPSGFPVTSWINDIPPAIDGATWRVKVGEKGYSRDDLVEMVDEDLEATIDCTGGWYSTQDWSGVRLDRLVEPGEWRSIEVISTTGYARRYPVSDLDRLWLAVAVGGDPLSVGHGYPARIVAPDRRGFWWVKWVAVIRPSMTPWWVQSPFPLT